MKPTASTSAAVVQCAMLTAGMLPAFDFLAGAGLGVGDGAGLVTLSGLGLVGVVGAGPASLPGVGDDPGAGD